MRVACESVTQLLQWRSKSWTDDALPGGGYGRPVESRKGSWRLFVADENQRVDRMSAFVANEYVAGVFGNAVGSIAGL